MKWINGFTQVRFGGAMERQKEENVSFRECKLIFCGMINEKWKAVELGH